MKVKALIMFNDLIAKKLRKENEIFEVSSDRASELNAGPHGVLIEMIEEQEVKKGTVSDLKPTSKGGGAGVRKNKSSTKS